MLETLIPKARLRSAPHYRLTPFGRLPAAQQSRLADLCRDQGFFGLLTSAADGSAVRAIDRDAARLFRSLQRPARLPAVATMRSLGADAPRRVALLILDGVLEIAHEGRFVSGLAAYPILFDVRTAAPVRGRIARLSAQAMTYGLSLTLTDPAEMAPRLYACNAAPATPRWRRTLPDRAAVDAFLGSGPRGRASSSKVWLTWRARGATAIPPSAATWKLYVSPHAEQLPDALRSVTGLLERPWRAVAFKVGADLHGILRPDKLVVYFRTRDDLVAAGERLTAELRGMTAQGVPFTAEFGLDGLLSWGVDPPRNRRILDRQGTTSWRSWVTLHLARSLLSARRAGANDALARRYAMDRLALEGLDTRTWTPAPTLWLDAKDG